MGHGVLLSLNGSLDKTFVPKSIELLSSPIQTVSMSAPNIAFWMFFLEFSSSSDPEHSFQC